MCEALVHAAASVAVANDPNWLILHPFEPIFRDTSLVDIFDLGILHVPSGKDAADKALILQVTQWPDQKEVAEEANKSYEVHETCEEFSYLGSRTRVSNRACTNLPGSTAFGNVMFGNRRYVRKWIPSHLELFLDFVSYPSYDRNAQYPDGGLYHELDLVKDMLDDEQVLIKELQKRIVNGPNGAIRFVGSRITKQLEGYIQQNLPLSPFSSAEYKARAAYRHSGRYVADLNFLHSQIEENGMPSERFRLKESFMAGGIASIPSPWKGIVDAVMDKAAEKMPEVEAGRFLLRNAETLLPELLSCCRKHDLECLRGLWNHEDKAKRIAYRVIFVQLYGGSVDDFYDGEVTEQNFSSKQFSEGKTRKILTMVMDGAIRNAPRGSDLARWTRSLRTRIEDLFNYMAINGTKNTPTTWALSHLIESDHKLRNRVADGGQWSSFTSGVFTNAAKPRLITFPSIPLSKLPTVTLRSEFSTKGTTRVYVKSKPTTQEEGRRAKEEGNKAWLGRLVFRCDSSGNITSSFSDSNYWIWADGNWGNQKNLERLVECGWRVFLDPRTLVRELADFA